MALIVVVVVVREDPLRKAKTLEGGGGSCVYKLGPCARVAFSTSAKHSLM